jgi:Fe-S-cluster containining protein
MIEPSKNKETARRYADENLAFRSFLKNRADSDELDIHFAQLHHELFAAYDCCQCHNCCEVYSVQLTDEDAEGIAAFLGIGKELFVKGYTQNADGDGYEIKPPCPFLESDGKCRVQPCKPEECRGYPYTDRPDRLGSLYGVIEFAEVCPVVFVIVQRLKRIYGFRSRVRG